MNGGQIILVTWLILIVVGVPVQILLETRRFKRYKAEQASFDRDKNIAINEAWKELEELGMLWPGEKPAPLPTRPDPGRVSWH